MKKKFFLLLLIIIFAICYGQVPVPKNTIYKIITDKEEQFSPKTLKFGFGTGKFHLKMKKGPIILFSRTAYCAPGWKNPAIKSKALVISNFFIGFSEYPQIFKKVEKKYEKEKPLINFLNTLKSQMDKDVVFLITVKAPYLPIKSIIPYSDKDYIMKKISKGTYINLLGFIDKEHEPYVIGWISYRPMKKYTLREIPSTLENKFSIFEFNMGVFYITEVKGKIYPIEIEKKYPYYIKPELVNLKQWQGEMYFDIRYATENNFTGEKIYPFDFCYLCKEPAMALKKVNDYLRNMGYALKVYDAYRPLWAQYKFWEVCPNPRYVARPWNGSVHNRGCAVDVTLVTKDGKDLEMPTDFDDFSPKAAAYSKECSEEAIKNRSILQKAMTKFGFQIYEGEWWHFNYRNYKKYPIFDFLPLKPKSSNINASSNN